MIKTIKENLIGLANFLCLFVQAFLIPRRRQPQLAPGEAAEDSTKYDSLVGPSTELVGGLESLFCPKCHVLVAQVRQTDKGTEIFQNGKRITVANNITIGKNGNKQMGFPISCPNGHAVRIPSPLPAKGGG